MSSPLRFSSFSLSRPFFAGIVIDITSQRRPKASQVGATVRIEDVVGEGLDGFSVGIGVLQRDFDLGVVDRFVDVEDIVVNRFFANIEVLDVALDATFKVEAVASVARFFIFQRGIRTPLVR